MTQAHLRYFGVTLGDHSAEGPTEPRLGRFVPMSDPMPVGTAIELDGVAHVVTRVEEGARPGAWLWAEGATYTDSAPAPDSAPSPDSAVPRSVDDIPTAPTKAPTPPASAVPDAIIEDDKTIATPDEPESDAPTAVSDETSGKPDDPKRKRRRPKTTLGR